MRIHIFLGLFLFFNLPLFKAFGNEVNREGLQAAFIYKFTNYIEWPADESRTFNIGVENNPAMLKALEEIFRDKSIGKKRVVVFAVDKINKTRMHIIHLESVKAKSSKELKALNTPGLLVISQDDAGIQERVIINFMLMDEGKLRFDINNHRAIDNELKINSRLLNLARSHK